MKDIKQLCDLTALKLDESKITQTKIMHQRHGNYLYRLNYHGKPFILKIFHDTPASEILCYTLLEEYGVPTIEVYERSENAILLEDLDCSTQWRLASEENLDCPATGSAVAKWYLELHSAGQRIISELGHFPDFLQRESGILNAETVWEIGQRFNVGHLSIWKIATDRIEELKQAMYSLPETLNYNDFYWTNLTVSRTPQTPSRAMMFDYHLMGIGPRYSDCRNVTSSLGKKAQDAFWESYGSFDEEEKILDYPLSLLASLAMVSEQTTYPKWVYEMIAEIETGEFENNLWKAVEIL